MDRILETKNITVKYGENVVLNKVSADFKSGVMTAVIGSNGVGKTTYLKSIAGLINSSGEIALCEDGNRTFNKKEIAYVPQLGALNTKLTVFEMVLLGLVNNLKWHVTDEQIDKVCEIMKELGIERISKQPFNTLSGGQKQLVSMAQSLIGRPKVLLLDEPTSALDLRHQLIVMDIAKKYTEENNVVTIFIVHDLMLASRYGKNIMVLHDGGVFGYDSADKILTPELIETVYGVKARVIPVEEGYHLVLPLSPM